MLIINEDLEFSQVFFYLLLIPPPPQPLDKHMHTYTCVRSCVCLFDRRRHKDSALNSDIACRKGLDCFDQI